MTGSAYVEQPSSPVLPDGSADVEEPSSPILDQPSSPILDDDQPSGSDDPTPSLPQTPSRVRITAKNPAFGIVQGAMRGIQKLSKHVFTIPISC